MFPTLEPLSFSFLATDAAESNTQKDSTHTNANGNKRAKIGHWKRKAASQWEGVKIKYK